MQQIGTILQTSLKADFAHAFKQRNDGPEERKKAQTLLALLRDTRKSPSVPRADGQAQFVVQEFVGQKIVFEESCRCERRAFKLAKRRLKKKGLEVRIVRVYRRQKMLREWKI
jgi:hypothetical protein